jgi:hypothetical protein
MKMKIMKIFVVVVAVVGVADFVVDRTNMLILKMEIEGNKKLIINIE